MIIIIIIIIWLMKDFVRWDTNSFKWHTSSTPHFTKPAIPSHVHNSRHVSLFWNTSIQATASHPVFKAILILSFHLRLRILSCLFPSYFPHQNPVCISCVPHTLPISTFLIFHRNNFRWQVHIMKSAHHENPYFEIFSSLLSLHRSYVSVCISLRPAQYGLDCT